MATYVFDETVGMRIKVCKCMGHVELLFEGVNTKDVTGRCFPSLALPVDLFHKLLGTVGIAANLNYSRWKALKAS